jgi:hypothetical protein
MVTLERKAVKPSNLMVDDGLMSLGQRANEFLGYDGLVAAIDKEKMVHGSVKTAAEVFTKLGFDPFDPIKVERYKKQELKRANRGYGWWEFCSSDGAGALFAISAVIVVVATILNVIYAHPFAHMWGYWVPVVALAPVLIVLPICSSGNRNKFEWATRELRYSRAQVPAFALSRAIELKTELPTATFWVDSLEAHKVTRDPFMVMRYEGADYYVDVWEEPKFEGRRVV